MDGASEHFFFEFDFPLVDLESRAFDILLPILSPLVWI